MLDYVRKSFESSFIVIAEGNSLLLRIRVLLVRHEDGYLCA